jgi:hypothetical protein
MATIDIEAMIDATTSERCEDGEMGVTDGWFCAPDLQLREQPLSARGNERAAVAPSSCGSRARE